MEHTERSAASICCFGKVISALALLQIHQICSTCTQPHTHTHKSEQSLFLNLLHHNSTMKLSITILSCFTATAVAFTPSAFVGKQIVGVPTSSSTSLEMKYKVAVVGGGPSGACAAEIFAQEKNIDTVFFERKMDNAKPCGGAIPLCMIGEFGLPETVVDRKVCTFCWMLKFAFFLCNISFCRKIRPVETSSSSSSSNNNQLA